ncbi:hypothetical protein [Psychrobacter aquaticus]|uniref:Uncharacterized protein n=1 Tax=Psychrobacter aquaticus CMS 56 TaxID=1354303 RepID=U4T2A9_9GAMM|nr:hypothetical protein [Psychrobacter aquaticus]ERL54625.1 hypothetical protein M917_2773 [Psychrobacter aquaticus CMS 56]
MSDKKNDFETDFEEKWAEISSKKSRNVTNNNIYERFISRVQNEDGNNSETDDVEPLENAKNSSALNSSAFEPLSANELELFSGQDTGREVGLEATDAPFDFLAQETQVSRDLLPDAHISSQDSHLNEPSFNIGSDGSYGAPTNKTTGLADTKENTYIPDSASVISQESPIQSAVKESIPSQDKLASSKKPLIIGMIFGSLLIVIIVVTLIFTGILSTSTEKAVPAATEPASPVITSTAQPTSTIDNPISVDASSTDNLAVEAQQGNISATNQDQNAVTNNVVVVEMPKTAPAIADESNTEAAITYEDFRQESQSTLYRETDD